MVFCLVFDGISYAKYQTDFVHLGFLVNCGYLTIFKVILRVLGVLGTLFWRILGGFGKGFW